MAILGKKGAVLKCDLNEKDDDEKLREDHILFTEKSGYVLEVADSMMFELKKLADSYNTQIYEIGVVEGDRIIFNDKIDIKLEEAEKVWRESFSEVLR
jgi:hypothetical protein